jgi:hypothetical protein
MSRKHDAAPEPARPATPDQGDRPETPGSIPAAWIVFAVALVSLLMAAHGDGLNYLWVGVALTAVAAVLLVIGKAQAERAD